MHLAIRYYLERVCGTMPAKAAAASNSGADATPKKRKISQADSDKKQSGVSFEVYHSEAATFQSTGEFRKAINSYTRVNISHVFSHSLVTVLAFLLCHISLGYDVNMLFLTVSYC